MTAVPGPSRLEQRFADQHPLLSASEATEEAGRCLYCHDAPCIRSCPTSIDIPTFIRKIGTSNLRGAARTILSANLLGASCARVCPVEVLCESTCVYVQQGRPAIAIGRLQRYAMAHGAAADLLPRQPASGKSVGCVGAGPASLACAGTAALLGHHAVLYERAALPGGLNSHGVAPYKQKLTEALAEVEFVQALGVEIRTGVEVGRDVSAEQLLRTHDAVFLGPGLGLDSQLTIPGADGPGVVGAVEWIAQVKTKAQYGLGRVDAAVVVGGGNTGVDAARELKGLGVARVSMVYRRRGDEMSAYAHELALARAAGVVVLDEVAVAEVQRQAGRVCGVRLVATRDGQPTTADRGSLPADLVVLAIGQARLRDLARSFPGVVCDQRGCIVADPVRFVTGNPRVFAGGDARNGGMEVVNAVHEGQAAARAMHALLTRSSHG